MNDLSNPGEPTYSKDGSSSDPTHDLGSGGRAKKKQGRRGPRGSVWKEDEQNLGEQLLQEFADFQSSRSHKMSESECSVGSERMEGAGNLCESASPCHRADGMELFEPQVANVSKEGTVLPCKKPTCVMEPKDYNNSCVSSKGSSELLQQQTNNKDSVTEPDPVVALTNSGSLGNPTSHDFSASPSRNERNLPGNTLGKSAEVISHQNPILASEQSHLEPLEGNQPIQEPSEGNQNNLNLLQMPANTATNNSPLSGIVGNVSMAVESNTVPEVVADRGPVEIKSMTIPGLTQDASVASAAYEPVPGTAYEQQESSEYYTLTELTPVNPVEVGYDSYPMTQNYPVYYDQNPVPSIPNMYMQPQPNPSWVPPSVPPNTNAVTLNPVNENNWQPAIPVLENTGTCVNNVLETQMMPPMNQQVNQQPVPESQNCTSFLLPPVRKEDLNKGQLVTLGTGNLLWIFWYYILYCEIYYHQNWLYYEVHVLQI